MKMIYDESIIAFEPELIRIRRHLHANPELRFEEQRTSDYIASLLDDWGIPVVRGIGGYGLVGVLRHGTSERSIGLRADMDALPMHEANTFAHASRYSGKMHACGHDGHTAMLLGAARYLSQHRHFDGTVNFIFQPAEEGGCGARLMIEDGLFNRCPMDAVFGVHNWPGMPAGNFGIRPGALMASSNTFEVHINGRGSHAGQPHRSADPVMVAVQIAQAWQTIVSRNVDPNESAVLSVTQIHAGSAVNVIPEQAMLNGTVRSFSVDVLDMIESRMRTVAEGIAAAFDIELTFNFTRIYPALVNHAAEAALAGNVMRDLVGAANVDENVERTMTSEDFAFYMLHKPGAYAFIGNGDGSARLPGQAGGLCQLHSASYDFNDALLPLGTSYWVALAHAYLDHPGAEA
ncbi:amidohydrolase [Paraburkholderia madseniana]|uniref:Amidohydrolase n=2 Tax=Paraburkholderia madseniana TaxID=2599607 RepID=A0A6N6WIW5_9BURK|nr:M20 aminoacylase family protein [Paraburkholderia madseniana]KAE8759380.1 amidohydrolase [Paraburkholderia madseniana]